MIPQHDYVAIVASGPSVENFEPLDGFVHIAVNNALSKICDRADYWFTLDPSHTNQMIMKRRDYPNCRYYAAVPKGYGTQAAPIVSHRRPRVSHVTYLKRVEGIGLSEDPEVIHTRNSAFGALGLAYHMRPKIIYMIGVDGTNQLKFDGTGCQGSLNHLPDLFESAVPQLKMRGIEVVNGSLSSRIECFKKMNLGKGLAFDVVQW